MTTYRFHWRPSSSGDRREGVLFVRIIHKRRFKDIMRPYAVMLDEWNPVTRTLRFPDVNSCRHRTLRDISVSIRQDLSRLESIVKHLSVNGDYTVYDICREFYKLKPSNTLSGYVASLKKELDGNGQHRTARAYVSAARSLVSFTGGDICLNEITPVLIKDYEQYLLEKGLQMNTISFYMRNLRAVYYRALNAGILTGQGSNPFKDVFTGVYQTRHRALGRDELARLAALSGKVEGRLKDALMYFMFAYHSRGMSFIDLAHLKKTDLCGNTIRYKRRKTGFFLEVKITGPMRVIMNRFRKRTKNSVYVFPIMAGGGEEVMRYENALARQNRLLKEVASMAGVVKCLTTHVARHTWATIAKRLGYSIPLISEGLGHRDIRITTIYLASFERSALDELSNRLSRAVKAA